MWIPAIAPSATGVKGGRETVVPTSGMERDSVSARMAWPVMLEVLPWSVAMPSVV